MFIRSLWRCRLWRLLLGTALAGSGQFAYADAEFAVTEYAASWGPSIGASAPMLAALDQDGNQQDLKSLSGSSGLLFVFNRSVDW